LLFIHSFGVLLSKGSAHCTAEYIRKRSTDAVEQISSENVTDYLNSEYAKYAERVLFNHVEATCPIPTASDFVQARNHLLVLMSLTNAEISGVLINLSLSTNSIKCTELLQRSMVTPATSGSVTLHRPDVTDITDATSSVSQNEERGCQMQKRVIWNREDRDIVRNKFMTFVKREKTPIVENDSVLNRDTAL